MEENVENKSKNKKRVKAKKYELSDLEQIKKNQEVIDMLVESIDESLNMIGVIGSNIKAMIPRDEASSIVGEDGQVEEKYIVNKVGRIVQACIKDIIKNDDDTFEVIVSKRILELKVRKWMYMHLKPGMKLRGIVRNLTEYAAFIDVGGGVTGILKNQDATDIHISHASEMFKLGQRLQVIVKKYDRDTGRIELSYKEFLKSFDDMVKKYSEGDIVEGVVRNRTKTGVFVELEPNLVGLAEHVSGIEYGQKVLVSIRRIVPEKKKVKLIIIG